MIEHTGSDRGSVFMRFQVMTLLLAVSPHVPHSSGPNVASQLQLFPPDSVTVTTQRQHTDTFTPFQLGCIKPTCVCLQRVYAALLLLQGHTDSVTTAVLSPDETLLATASYDRTARLWSLGRRSSGNGMCLKVLQHTDPVSHVAFSGNRALVAAAAAAAQSVPGAAAAAAAAASGPQRLVTACDGHALWLWDVDSGTCVAALGEHKDRVTSVAFSPDGRLLASTSQDRSVLVWDAAAGHLLGLYVGDAAMVTCCFAWRGTPQPLPPMPQLSNGRLQVRLQLQPPGQQQQQHGSEASSSQSGRQTPAAAEVGMWPSPGGLSLLVGDTTGRVHFITCC
jgi:WD40 repeat protein